MSGVAGGVLSTTVTSETAEDGCALSGVWRAMRLSYVYVVCDLCEYASAAGGMILPDRARRQPLGAR